MSPELISILAFVAMFVAATVLPVNIGILALMAAFLVGQTVAGLSADDIFAGFPGDLFTLLVGVTYLFAIAQNNGTIDWLVDLIVRGVRGRLALIPWAMFVMGVVLTAIGAPSPGATAILAPIALGIGAQYGISQLLMGVVLVHGTQAGSFSPISVYGAIVNSVLAGTGFPSSPLTLFIASLVVNTIVAAAAFFVLGGRDLLRRGKETGDAADATRLLEFRVASARGGGTEDVAGPNLARVLTLLGIVALAVAALAFDIDIGFAAITVSVVLSLVSPSAARDAVAQVSWAVVLLVCGVLTFISVLQEMGTIEYLGTNVAGLGAPLLVVLLLCYVAGISSAFASSTALLGALVPLAFPLLAAGQSNAIGVVAAISVSAVIVDVSPFSTSGAIVLANGVDVDRNAFYRRLLIYGAVVTVVGPALVWLALVVPTGG